MIFYLPKLSIELAGYFLIFFRYVDLYLRTYTYVLCVVFHYDMETVSL